MTTTTVFRYDRSPFGSQSSVAVPTEEALSEREGLGAFNVQRLAALPLRERISTEETL